MHPSSGNFFGHEYINKLLKLFLKIRQKKTACPKPNPNPETGSNLSPGCNSGLCFRNLRRETSTATRPVIHLMYS